MSFACSFIKIAYWSYLNTTWTNNHRTAFTPLVPLVNIMGDLQCTFTRICSDFISLEACGSKRPRLRMACSSRSWRTQISARTKRKQAKTKNKVNHWLWILLWPVLANFHVYKVSYSSWVSISLSLTSNMFINLLIKPQNSSIKYAKYLWAHTPLHPLLMNKGLTFSCLKSQ